MEEEDNVVIEQSLLIAGSTIVHITEKDGWTALHHAVIKGPIEVGSVLIEGANNVDEKDSAGSTALHLAARWNYLDVVHVLIAAKENVDEKDNMGLTALHKAVEMGHVDVVKALLAAEAKVDENEGNGLTALHKAAMMGRIDLVHPLLTARAKLDFKNNDGDTALHLAAGNGHRSLVQTLLASGAKIDEKNHKGWTALHWATKIGHEDIVDALVMLGAKIDEKSHMGTTALHMAASNNLLSAVHYLIAAEAKVDERGDKGFTALHFAASTGHTAIVQALLAAGAKVDEKANKGSTALHTAVFFGRLEVVHALLAAGAMVNEKNDDGFTALHYAALRDFADIVHALLLAGAKVNDKSNKGTTPLHFAAEKGLPSVVQTLLEAESRVDEKDANGRTALHFAAVRGYVPILYALIAAGAKIDEIDNKGSTALHAVTSFGLINRVDILLKAGVKVDKKRPDGWTSLHIAARMGRSDVVRALCAAGARVDEKNNEAWTALHLASRWNRLAVLLALIAAGAKFDEVDNHGQTALHLAAFNGHVGIVHNLVAVGSKVDQKDINRSTALHKAAFSGHVHVVRALLAAGAVVDAKAIDKWTPLRWAAKNRHMSVVFTLIAAGAKFEHNQEAFRLLKLDQLFDIVQQDVSVSHLHVCGVQMAGKSIISHWIYELLYNRLTHRLESAFGSDKQHEISLPLGRTRGIETRTINFFDDDKNSGGGRKVMHVHDYGGQSEFQINHATSLAVNHSAYVIVLPMWNWDAKPVPAAYSYSEVESILLHWLRFIYSTIKKRQLQKKVRHRKPAVSSEDESAAIIDEIPIVIIINVFSEYTKIQASKQREQARSLLASAKRIYSSTKSNILHDDGFLFAFLEPICIDACWRSECKEALQPILAAVSSISTAKMNVYRIVDEVKKEMVNMQQQQRLPIIMRGRDLLAFITQMVVGYVSKGKLGTSPVILQKIVPNLVLLDLLTIGEILPLRQQKSKSNKILQALEDELLISSPNWLTNKVFGNILYATAKAKTGREGLVFDEQMLASMICGDDGGYNSSILGEGDNKLSVAQLLQRVGLCVPVVTDDHGRIVEGELEVVDIDEKVAGLAPTVNKRYLMLGLIEESILLSLPQLISKDSSYRRCVSRFFSAANDRCMIIPGFYMRLFVFIRNLTKDCKYVKFWSDGMHMIVNYFDTSAVGSHTAQAAAAATPLVGELQFLVQPMSYGQLHGFEVIVMTNNIPLMVKSDGLADLALSMLDEIRRYLQDDIQGIELREYCFSYTERDLLGFQEIATAEAKWFSSLLEERLNVRDIFFGSTNIPPTTVDLAQEEEISILISKSFREDGRSLVGLLEAITGEGGESGEGNRNNYSSSGWLVIIARSLSSSQQANELDQDKAIRAAILDAIRDDRCAIVSSENDKSRNRMWSIRSINKAVEQVKKILSIMLAGGTKNYLVADEYEVIEKGKEICGDIIAVDDTKQHDIDCINDVERFDATSLHEDGDNDSGAMIITADKEDDSDQVGGVMEDFEISEAHEALAQANENHDIKSTSPSPGHSLSELKEKTQPLLASSADDRQARLRLEQKVDILLQYQHNQATGIFNYPILPVISEPDSQGILLGRAKRLVGRVYRVHFLCAVCGCCAPSGHKGNGKGYALPYQGKLTLERLQLFKNTLLIADLLLNLHGVPFKPSVIASCALSTVSTVASELIAANLLKREELDGMKSRFTSVLDAAAAAGEHDQKQQPSKRNEEAQSKKVEQKRFIGSRRLAAMLGSSSKEGVSTQGEENQKEESSGKARAVHLEGYQQPILRFGEVFGATYLAWIRGLLLAVGERDPDHVLCSGLVPVDHKASGKRAWVCKGGTETSSSTSNQPLLTDSNCYRRFLEEGEECLMIRVSYG